MKLRFLKILRFYYVESSFSNDDSEQLENRFGKQAEDFVTNTSKNNNLSQFSYRCDILGESNPSLTPNFRISEFPYLTHVFERSWENENESQRNEKGFFSQQTNIQNPLLVCTQLFLFERYGSIFEQHISRNFCLFQPPHKFEFEIGKEVIRSIFRGY
jgi:hypothetical protein